MNYTNTGDNEFIDDLFVGLAEQIKLPFVQILHAAELLENPQYLNDSKLSIELASKSALRLIDGYLLSVKIQRRSDLNFEPVSLSSLMYDTAEELSEVAKANNCEIELNIAGKYGPVFTNSRILSSALANIGQSLIESVSNEEKQSDRIIKLAVRKNSFGISTGIYSKNNGLSNALLMKARQLHGMSYQPMLDFASDNVTGVFVADRLLDALDAKLRVAKLKGNFGLATTLTPSNQLSLV